jgi:protein gp37
MPISYAPTSWNPVVGCTPVSEGCKNCWAMKLHNQRHKGYHSYKNFPVQYLKPFEEVQLLPERLSEPLRWRTPRTVAVCFMGDLFHEQVPIEFIRAVFYVMENASQHTFLLLTKRPQRAHDTWKEYLLYPPPGEAGVIFKGDAMAQWLGGKRLKITTTYKWPENVWLGVTAENQRMADERISLLLKTPAAHRWASLEPLLGPINMYEGLSGLQVHMELEWEGDLVDLDGARLDWVVVGGESGPGHRPMDPQWAADIYAQCHAANVGCYFKQIAESRPGQPSGIPMLDTAKALPWHAEPLQEEDGA